VTCVGRGLWAALASACVAATAPTFNCLQAAEARRLDADEARAQRAAAQLEVQQAREEAAAAANRQRAAAQLEVAAEQARLTDEVAQLRQLLTASRQAAQKGTLPPMMTTCMLTNSLQGAHVLASHRPAFWVSHGHSTRLQCHAA
jgi:hypothetical protein